MRQEIKFCADVYRVIYDHLDTSSSSPVYLCLDGAAAEKGVREKLLTDVSMPDFLWRFRGGTSPFLMEAKVVRDGEISFCGDGQPAMWCAGGFGVYKPVLWLGIDEDEPILYAWEHAGFDQSLVPLVGRGRTAGGNKKTLHAKMPSSASSYSDLASLVQHIVSFAKANGYYP